ncbi:MATE family efflux transporter [Rubneribacter sp.]
MTAPSTLKQLLALAVPTFGQLIAEPVFVLIDTAIVGHVSDAALAGLSLGSTVILTAVGLCIFLAYSTTSQVAHLLGAGRRREGLQAGMDGLWLSAAIGAVLAAALFAFAGPLCEALGGRGDDARLGAVYVQTVALGVPGMLLVYAANGIFRGLQNVRITLVAAACGAALNTALDILFVIGFGWGIAGSGIATCIAQWFMAAFLVIPAVRWAVSGGAGLRPRAAGVASAGGDGLPLFLRTLALRAGLVATVMAAASLGTDVLAGYQVVNATWNFALNVLDSVAIAGQTLAGARLGAKDHAGARALVRETARAGLLAGAAVGAAFALAGLAAPGLFSPSQNVREIATVGMVVVGVGLPLQGWMWALDGILIGAGDFRYLALTCALASAAHIATLCALVLAAPLLPSGLMRVALLWAAFDIVLMGGRALANGLRIRSDRWMR